MATDLIMPRLSDSMEEGTVLKWLVEEGAQVKRGDPIAEIETDKANMIYESDEEGTLVEIVAGEGDTVAIGEVIARFGEPGEASGGEQSGDGGAEAEEQPPDAEGAEEARPAAQAEQPQAEAEEEPDSQGAEGKPGRSAEEEGQGEAPEGGASGADGDGSARADDEGGATAASTEPRAGTSRTGTGRPKGDGDGRVKASPVARRMARDLGVELSALEGSGPGGRVVKADVEAAAGDGGGAGDGGAGAPATGTDGAVQEQETHAPAPPPSERPAAGEGGVKGGVQIVDLSRLQKTVARRMAESKATAPDFQLSVQVDMEACVALREQLKLMAEQAPSYNDMVVKACAVALREFPRANGSYRDGAFELYDRINIGIAVAAQDALVVPTIFDADRKSLGEIAREARALAEKVRDGDISPPELSGGTFTVSNLGMQGIDEFTAVVNPPQAGILAVGSMKPRPVVDADGRIVARNTMNIRLSADHRILYGADAAAFVSRIRELLEQPLGMAL